MRSDSKSIEAPLRRTERRVVRPEEPASALDALIVSVLPEQLQDVGESQREDAISRQIALAQPSQLVPQMYAQLRTVKIFQRHRGFFE
jgi:hypothetical protein